MKIICIGRNYIDHAKELHNPVPEEPIYFFKPDCALLLNNKPFYIPEFSSEIHHELEIVIRINRLGKHIEEKFANRYYEEIGLGIDFTARDVQKRCKEKGLPWEKAKAFDYSAPLSKFIHKSKLPELNKLDFELYKNDQLAQKGNSKDMIFNIDTLIAYVSQFVTLKIGDLLYTGTPSGVGPVKIGDTLRATLNGQELLNFDIK